MKKCPFCAEEIQDEAVVCRFCGRDLVEKPAAQPAGAIQVEIDKLKDERALREKERESAVSQRTWAIVGILAGLVIGFIWNWWAGGFLLLAGLLALATQSNKASEARDAIAILDQKIESRRKDLAG